MKEFNRTNLFEISEFGSGFSINEAVRLLNHEVIHKSHLHDTHSLEKIGLISGLLTINDEVEIIIQFYESTEKFTKQEFNSEFVRVT